MYPRSFLCEETKIKKRTSLKKELCEIGEEAIWDPDSHPFFIKGVGIIFIKFYALNDNSNFVTTCVLDPEKLD